MKTSAPAAFSVTTPPVTATPAPPAMMALPATCVTVSASPSGSVSLARTAIVAAVSSVPVKLSFAASGASLVGVTVPPTVAVDVAPLGSATV